MGFDRFEIGAVSLLAWLLLTQPAGAIEVRQLAAAAHAFPVMYDLEGRKIANGEFTQEIRDGLLRIQITYKLKEGGKIEEAAAFEQQPELIQKEWSWRETKNDAPQREYKVDFDAGKATARKREQGALQEYADEVKIEPGQTFAGFGFVLALANLRDRLVRGEAVELKVVGFTPKPRLVSVKLTAHGTDQVRMSGRVVRGEHFMIKPEIPAIAKLFIKISDTNIWLTPPPSGFLRWEGPLAEPGDSLVRVDLSAGDEAAPAEPATDR